MAKREMKPGTKVKLTGKFLKSTGQIAGGEGQTTFIVQECACKFCSEKRWVVVNQVRAMCDPKGKDYDPQYVADLLKEGSTTWRHINRENLFVVGEVDIRNCP